MRLYKLYRYEKKTPTELLNRMKKNEKRKGNKRRKNNPIAETNPVDANATEAKFIMPTSIPNISSFEVEVVKNASVMLPIVEKIKGSIEIQKSEDKKILDIDVSSDITSTVENNEANDEVVDVLEQSKAELEKEIMYLCELESSKKNIRADNKKLEQRLLKAEEILKSFAEQLEKQKAIVQEVMKDMKENNEKLKENKELISLAREEKRILEKRIAQMQSIKVWFGGKDESSASDSVFDYYEEDIEVETELIAAKMSELLTESAEILDDLSVKQLKQIAKILLVVEKVQNKVGDKKVELTFKETTPITETLENLRKVVVVKNK